MKRNEAKLMRHLARPVALVAALFVFGGISPTAKGATEQQVLVDQAVKLINEMWDSA